MRYDPSSQTFFFSLGKKDKQIPLSQLAGASINDLVLKDLTDSRCTLGRAFYDDYTKAFDTADFDVQGFVMYGTFIDGKAWTKVTKAFAGLSKLPTNAQLPCPVHQ